MITENFKQKFNIIYVRFLIIAFSFIIGYTFLRWLLFIQFNVLDINEDLLNLWLPFTLPLIPLLIWLNPRLKLLKNRTKKGKEQKLGSLYIMVALFAIAAPTIVAQNYLENATGKLTALPNVSSISAHALTKYYTITKYYIDKDNKQIKYTSEVTGKNNEDIDLTIYIAIPICDHAQPIVESDSSQTFDTSIKFTPPVVELVAPLAWLCVKYTYQISNHLSDSAIKNKEDDFYDKTMQVFADRDLNTFFYLNRIGHTMDRVGYIKAINNFSTAIKNPILLEPEVTTFESRLGNEFPWIFGALGIGLAVTFLLLFAIKFDDEKLQKFVAGQPAADNDAKDFFTFFKPKEGFYITPIIMCINIAVFIAMVCAGLGFISFDIHGLLNWGADYGPYTTNGQWWRLLTSIFIHGGLMHLLANMYGLLFVGIFLEPVIGKTKYIIAYLVTGLIASVTSIYWNAPIVSVGASGAIFGLYGVFLALLLLGIFPKKLAKTFLLTTSIFIVYNLIIGLTGKGTDNAAHIGGLLSGFIMGFVLKALLPDDVKYKEAEKNVEKPI